MKLPTTILVVVLTLASAAAFSCSVTRRDFAKTAGAAVIATVPSLAMAAAEKDAETEAVAKAPEGEKDADGFITTDSGLKYKITKEGTGGVPGPAQQVKAHYTGWLEGFDSDKKFDSSRDRGKPFMFRVGAGQVIRGWEETFSTMKVGERRQIIIPARLGYGKCTSQGWQNIGLVVGKRHPNDMLSHQKKTHRVSFYEYRRPWSWRCHPAGCDVILRRRATGSVVDSRVQQASCRN
jgi:FKBP-type peptidyl-prolyl cis-trans isomerase